MSRLRVLIAEDHGLVRAGLRSLLERLSEVDVVGEASDGHDALQAVAELRPDIVLMDLSMPGLNGLEAAWRISRDHPATRVLVLSMHADEEYVREAVRAGAAGYLVKSADREELVMALRAVARGETWLSPAVTRAFVAGLAGGVSHDRAGPYQSLTSRQREVLQLIAEGTSTKAIADRLQLSVKTVETHRARLMERLDIHDVAGLVRYALRVGIVGAE